MSHLNEKTWIPLGIAASVAAVMLAVGISWGSLSGKVERLRDDVSDIRGQITDVRDQVAEMRSLLANKSLSQK